MFPDRSTGSDCSNTSTIDPMLHPTGFTYYVGRVATNWGMACTCTLSLCIRDILSILLMLTYTLSTLKICGCVPNGNCNANLARLTLCFHLHEFVFRNRFRSQDTFHIILKTTAENYPL